MPADPVVAAGSTWPWLALGGLGAFHGLNPAMGWLFAVGVGLQEKRRSAVFKAIPAIALGHALSVGLVIAAVAGAQVVIPLAAIRWGGGAALVGFGVYRIWRRGRHPTWSPMRARARDLLLWSFVMASAHGAGLMVMPVVLHLPTAAHAGHAGSLGAGAERLSLGAAGVALGVHTLALFVVMAAVAWLVYDTVGHEVLRRDRINLDLIWSVALIGSGVATVVFAG